MTIIGRGASRGIGWMTSVLLAGGLSGCAFDQTSVRAWTPWNHSQPTRMVLLVTPSAMENNGVVPAPGILCRVYFFDGNEPAPMIVEGELAFTAFDRDTMTTSANEPLGNYRIPAKELSTHLRKDIVGNSYLFWLPMPVNRPVHVVVQGRFQSSKGHEVATNLVSVDMKPAATVGESSERVRPGMAVIDRSSSRMPQNAPMGPTKPIATLRPPVVSGAKAPAPRILQSTAN